MHLRRLWRRAPHRLVLFGDGRLIRGFSGRLFDGHGYQS